MSCCRTLPPDARLRVATCLFCPHAETVSGNPIRCTINGRTPVANAFADTCPTSRVINNGVVRWGVYWYGLPMPHRLYLWFRHPSHPHPKSWPGCGCMVWAKRLMLHVRHILSPR